MGQVLWTRAAEADLDAIYEYIGEKNRSPTAAARLLQAIDETCAVYARTPLLGEARPDLAPEIRLFRVGIYVVFYTQHDAGIEIARVLHGARDYARLFS